jgi:CRP/FNR family transcriptional regulator, cyclic AMP receptor protein
MSRLQIVRVNGSAAVGARPGGCPAETLADIGIFSGLSPDVVAALSRRCRWRRYAAGQTILQYQDEGRDVFFILAGRVCAVYYSACGREVRFSDIPAGDLFGEFAAIDGGPRAADVVSVTDTLIASMSAELFWEVLRSHDSVCAAILRRLTGIARATQRRVVEFSTLPVRSRLHAELIRMARISAPDGGAAIISPAPTHAEIASRISTHREAVTRELNELVRAKLIAKRGGDLLIHDTERLESLIEASIDEMGN